MYRDSSTRGTEQGEAEGTMSDAAIVAIAVPGGILLYLFLAIFLYNVFQAWCKDFKWFSSGYSANSDRNMACGFASAFWPVGLVIFAAARFGTIFKDHL